MVEGGRRTLNFKFESGAATPDLQSRNFFSSAGVLYAVDAHPVVGDQPEPLSTHWLTVDRQGNVRDSYRFGFNGTTGAAESYVVTRFDYAPWGGLTAVTGSTLTDVGLLSQFQGSFYDADIGAYKFGDRWMSPSLGRFMSEDPSGLRYGPNPNAALNNSPYNFTDPTGHWAIPVFVWGAKAALAYAGIQLGFATAETVVEGEFARQTGDYDNFSYGGSLAKNFGINLATGWVGGSQARLGARVGMYALRQGIEIGGETAYDVYNGRQFGSSLLSNTIGSVLGEAGGYAVKRAWRSPAGRIGRAFAGGFGEGLLETAAYRGRAFYSVSTGNVVGTAIEAVGNGVTRGLHNVRASAAAKVATDRHHSLPKFLGGFANQDLIKIPKAIHKEFHRLLRQELKAVGIPLNIGGKGGSALDWAQYFRLNQGAQRTALDGVLGASRFIDAKHGTNITQTVWQNIMNRNFKVFP